MSAEQYDLQFGMSGDCPTGWWWSQFGFCIVHLEMSMWPFYIPCAGSMYCILQACVLCKILVASHLCFLASLPLMRQPTSNAVTPAQHDHRWRMVYKRLYKLVLTMTKWRSIVNTHQAQPIADSERERVRARERGISTQVGRFACYRLTVIVISGSAIRRLAFHWRVPQFLSISHLVECELWRASMHGLGSKAGPRRPFKFQIVRLPVGPAQSAFSNSLTTWGSTMIMLVSVAQTHTLLIWAFTKKTRYRSYNILERQKVKQIEHIFSPGKSDSTLFKCDIKI